SSFHLYQSLAIPQPYSSSLHAALPISFGLLAHDLEFWWELALLVVIMLLGHWIEMGSLARTSSALDSLAELLPDEAERLETDGRSEEHTSELQSRFDLVCRLLLEHKKT